MEVILLGLGGVAGLVGGVFAGLSLGGVARSRPTWVFWLIGIGIVLGGVVITTLGQAAGLLVVAVLGVGLVGGGLTGLKYGAGRVPGVGPGRETLDEGQ
ncbi:MAG: hypothetical protein U1E29_15750 [Coriobacteriia bacterium]|nr:hypothetical protein [Coriobacteriia bacterium]